MTDDLVRRLRAAFKTNRPLQAEAADEIVRLRALLGNAVGAVIDSGGYCEGPHDVAAAIYRLTAERDRYLTHVGALAAEVTALEAANVELREFIGEPVTLADLKAPPDESRSAGSWQTMPDPYKAGKVRCVDGSTVHDFKGQSTCPGCGIEGIKFNRPAVSPAPVGLEGHTDPKERSEHNIPTSEEA